ncbi:MAG TPA: GspH/FimT family pseudopilin [Rhodanobacteraceae bacterium]|nr:GspH/FimT family pseudopilin [Rhodanobacteraceae bacterium]
MLFCRPRAPVPTPGFRARAAGFTLFEMLAVLLLIAITVSAVSLQVAKSLGGARVNAVSRDLVAALRYTRGQAIVHGKEEIIQFNLRDWSYTVPNHAAKKLPDGMELKIRTAAEEQVDDDTWGIRFYPDGSSTGGRVTVIRGQREWRIDVNWLTGEVRSHEVAG